MEPLSTSLFIATAIIAVTQAIKDIAPKIKGWVTVLVAGLIGLVVGLVDVYIGLPDVTIAEGIMHGLSAAGVVAVAKKI